MHTPLCKRRARCKHRRHGSDCSAHRGGEQLSERSRLGRGPARGRATGATTEGAERSERRDSKRKRRRSAERKDLGRGRVRLPSEVLHWLDVRVLGVRDRLLVDVLRHLEHDSVHPDSKVRTDQVQQQEAHQLVPARKLALYVQVLLKIESSVKIVPMHTRTVYSYSIENITHILEIN